MITACHRPKPVNEQAAPLSLNVADLLLVNDSPVLPIEQTRIYPRSLATEIQNWAGSHLKATGTMGKAVLRILDARVMEENIEPLLEGKKQDATLSVNIILSLEIAGSPCCEETTKIELRMMDKCQITPRDFDITNRTSIWEQFVQKTLNNLHKQLEDILTEDTPMILLAASAEKENPEW